MSRLACSGPLTRSSAQSSRPSHAWVVGASRRTSAKGFRSEAVASLYCRIMEWQLPDVDSPDLLPNTRDADPGAH